MPQTPHVERHFTGGEFVRDVVIGMSDGLTVPFALTAPQEVEPPPSQRKYWTRKGIAEWLFERLAAW
jgi:hypothetical protein